MNNSLGVPALLMCAFVVLSSGCGNKGTDCVSHDSTLCQEGVVYWVDSCGNNEALIEHCSCDGCTADQSDCKRPDCANSVCGSDGCGGLCPPGCAANASCSGAQGEQTCSCNEGYEGDGLVCSDMDECAIDNGACGDAVYWTCTNNVGSAPSCTDIDECALDNGGCGDLERWVCTNNIGAPATCVLPADCSGDPTVCDVNASCTQFALDQVCICDSGYAGDGMSCSDVNECATDNGGCGNPAHWECINNDGSPPTCEDIDECVVAANGTNACGTAADWECVDREGDEPICTEYALAGCRDWADWSCIDRSPMMCSCNCVHWPHGGLVPLIECEWLGGNDVVCTCYSGGEAGERLSGHVNLFAPGAGCGQPSNVFAQGFCGLEPFE